MWQVCDGRVKACFHACTPWNILGISWDQFYGAVLSDSRHPLVPTLRKSSRKPGKSSFTVNTADCVGKSSKESKTSIDYFRFLGKICFLIGVPSELRTCSLMWLHLWAGKKSTCLRPSPSSRAFIVSLGRPTLGQGVKGGVDAAKWRKRIIPIICIYIIPIHL